MLTNVEIITIMNSNQPGSFVTLFFRYMLSN